ncbi:acyl-CoA thioesterase [Pedobacter chitinilyticus]|uniref:Acyl-CoA thioesterase n=1 Tax=Pedobacter chitinilyticus TaxID=2233776 RepID=A0A3S3QHI9_9SPHI|nr:thioesterase family protein [Pedobacter chitinilyticus]RWU10320.1 acyl-CoA thioesterase [Pedobacter chitinilyticus]
MIFKTFWRKKEKTEDKKSVLESKTDIFKYRTDLEMRFTDLDMMGHVNNAMYFTYMEIGRTKYWTQAIQWDWKKTGVVIGQASINYLKPLHLGDKISIYVRTSRIGNTSFDLEYMIVKMVNGEEVICSKGKTVCVVYDYETKSPVAIPDRERSKMIEFEQL